MITGGPVTAVLDHLAIGTTALTDGWDLFGGVLGGTWVYGDDSPGFWWGQLSFAAGPKIELLTPTGGPDAAFLERFLTAHGAGPHHFNFIVSDIEATLGRTRAVGPLRPDRAPRQRPRRRDAAVLRGPGRPARLRYRGRCRADLARRPPASAGPPGRPGPRRGAAPRPLLPRRRQLWCRRPAARGPAGQAARRNGRAGRLAREPPASAICRMEGSRQKCRDLDVL